MAGTAGKNFRVKVSTVAGGAGAYNTVLDINNCSMSRDGAMLDITSFSDSDIKRILGLRDTSYELRGFYNSADATGQGALDSANLNGTEIWVEFLPNGVNGWKQQVMVPKFNPSSSVSGTNDLAVSLVGNGPIAVV